MSRKVFLIAFFLSFFATHTFAQTGISIFIKPLKCLKASEIIISEKDMSEILFSRINELADFEIKVLAEMESATLTPLSSFLISGDYQVEAEIFTVNYQIASAGNKIRHQHSVTGLRLPAAQDVLKSQIEGLFVAVNFLSIPKGAIFKIDNYSPGKTPISFSHFLVGKYQASLLKSDFSELIQDINITRDQTFTFELNSGGSAMSDAGFDAKIMNAPAKIVAPMIGKLLAFEKNIAGNITIYVLGAPDVAAEFEKGIGKTIGRATIVKVDQGPDLPATKPTILYIGDAVKVRQVLQYTQAEKVMSTTGQPALVQSGVALGIGIGEDGKPKVLLNVTTSEREALNWNPAIYEVAQLIK